MVHNNDNNKIQCVLCWVVAVVIGIYILLFAQCDLNIFSIK